MRFLSTTVSSNKCRKITAQNFVFEKKKHVLHVLSRHVWGLVWGTLSDFPIVPVDPDCGDCQDET